MSTCNDPFIQKLRQMCTKDKVMQSLYHNHISWSDVPSDDDILELDDWKSYQKIEKYTKHAYQQHHTTHKNMYITPRSKTKKNNQIASQIHTTPYHALPIISTLPIVSTLPSAPTVKKEIVAEQHTEHIVYQSPIEYEEMTIAPSTMPIDLNESIPYQPHKKSSFRYYVFLLIIIIYIMIRK